MGTKRRNLNDSDGFGDDDSPAPFTVGRPQNGVAATGLARLTLDRTPYGIAVLATAIAGGIRFSLDTILPGQASHIFFVPAILIASALGGWGPGILATILGLFLGVYFVAESRAMLPGDMITAFAFAGVGVGASWRGELLRRSRRAAAVSAEEALAREAHVKSILDTIPDAMIVIDERGVVQSFSAAAQRLFGYSPPMWWAKTSRC